MLLDAAYSEAEGFIQIVVGHFEEDRLKIDRQRWFTVPAELPRVEEFCERHAASNVYFTVSTFTEKTRTNENTKQTQLIWVDADTCAPQNFRVPPTFVVETSPERYQCYWLLQRPVRAGVSRLRTIVPGRYFFLVVARPSKAYPATPTYSLVPKNQQPQEPRRWLGGRKCTQRPSEDSCPRNAVP